VIVLHGFTGSAASMASVTQALAGEYRVHAIELLGHGESDAPATPALYSMDRCVGQVLAVMDALDAPRAHFVGYSMGGRVALSLAAACARRVASLTLIGVSPGLADAGERAARIEADNALAERILEGGIEAFVESWMALPLFASQRRLGARALAQARAQRLACRPQGLAYSLRGMGSGAMPPLDKFLPELNLPVLLVVGREDEKFAAIARTMRRALPRAELIEIDEAGHAAHLEQPAAFEAACRRFLASLPEVESAGAPRSGREPGENPTPTDTRSEPGEKRLP
jgi:2-succinyl-6-hydroxy-2,4-cyclohexadiene-1-carboxylate synthase